MGAQVVPALVVFQTPPDADARYQVAGSSGCTARSAMRPEMAAGPMPRKERPLNVSGLRRVFGSLSAARAAQAREAASSEATRALALKGLPPAGGWGFWHNVPADCSQRRRPPRVPSRHCRELALPPAPARATP